MAIEAEIRSVATYTNSPGTIPTASVSDRATKDDLLGFSPYVEAIATFLQAPETEAPITLSIEGEWGSGKSSFLLMLQKRIEQAPNPAIVIPFDAWRYDKQDELWAAFALHVTRGLRNGVSWPKRYWGDVKLFFSRIQGAVGWVNFASFALLWLLLLGAASCLLWWSWHASVSERSELLKALLPPAAAKAAAQSITAAASKPNANFYNFLLQRGPWIGSLGLLAAALGRLGKSVRMRLLDFRLERFIDRPDYKGHASFIEAFHEDFPKTLDAYLGDSTEKVYVMVDDLDRCDVPKAAELMQAINLMIGETNHLIFILGMDRDKVAAGIAYKYKEVLSYLPGIVKDADKPSLEERLAFGHAFLEKFIQLSFRVPTATDASQLRSFLEGLRPVQTEKAESHWSSMWAWLGYGQQTSFHRDLNYSPLSDRPDLASATEQQLAKPQSFTEYCRIHTGDESANVRDIVLMVKDVFNSNPRRLKLFLNAFRLSVYLSSRQGLFDRVAQSTKNQTAQSPITLEQLGKFVAIAMRCPRLLNDLTLDGYLIGRMSESSDTFFKVYTWFDKPGVKDLVEYGTYPDRREPFDPIRYRLKEFPAKKFLCVIPLAPEPSTQNSESIEAMIASLKAGRHVATRDKNVALARIAEKAAREGIVDELVEKRTSGDPFDILVAFAAAGRYVTSANGERIYEWSSMAIEGMQYRGTAQEEDFVQYHALRLIQDLLNAGRLAVKMRLRVRSVVEANLDYYTTKSSRGKNRLKLANTILERIAALDTADQPSSRGPAPAAKRTQPWQVKEEVPITKEPQAAPTSSESFYSSSRLGDNDPPVSL